MANKTKNKPMPKRRSAVHMAARTRNGGPMKNRKDRGGKSAQKRMAIQEACA